MVLWCRRSVAVLLVFSASSLSPLIVHAQQPQTPPQPAPPAAPPPGADNPGGSAVPHGAAGAIVTAPKDEPPSPPPAPVVVTPPALQRDDGAEYPHQAIVDKINAPVTVGLILEVDATGVVRKVAVEASAGHGFDEAAVAAAQRLVFAPATKNGKPVAAKIRHKYAFTPPPSRIVGKIASDSNDRGIARAIVTLTTLADGKPTDKRTLTTDDSGGWKVEGLTAGAYHVTVQAQGFATRESDEEVDPGQEIDLTLRLTRQNQKPVARPGEEPLEQVEVKVDRPPREVVKRTLDQREISRIPGTNGDALRSLQNLPGVARSPGLGGLLIVRGSAPQDTQVFIDGTAIPLVYHFGGLSSVVPTESLDRIDFYPGNFSSQYGRALGGIVDVGIKDPEAKDKKIHGLAQADLIDARVLAQGPIGDTGLKFLVAGRRSYFDVWLKPTLEATGAGVSAAPVYYDYQALVQKDFSSRQSLRLMLIGSDDNLRILTSTVNGSDPQLGGGIGIHTAFWRLQARYKNRISDKSELRVTGAVGQDTIDFNLGDNYLRVASVPISTRIELAQKLTQGVTMNFGIDWLYAPYDVAVRFPPPTRPGEPPGGPFLSRPPLEQHVKDATYTPAFYDEVELTPWRGNRIVPGVRVDYAKNSKSWDIQPRFVVRQDLTTGFPRTTVKGGAGVYSQPPSPQQSDSVFGNPSVRSNRSTQYDVGVEQEITRPVELATDVYYKQLDRLIVQGLGNVGTGAAYGIETLVRWKPDKRFFGWLAYTIGRSERRDGPGQPLRETQYDQTHVLTVLGSYRLGWGFEFGARFRLVSGNLYTPNNGSIYDEGVGAYLPLTTYPPNNSRLPPFHQLDIRVDKVWVAPNAKFSVYADIQNVYNHGNVEGVSNNFNSTQRVYATGIPILPSLGVRGEM